MKTYKLTMQIAGRPKLTINELYCSNWSEAKKDFSKLMSEKDITDSVFDGFQNKQKTKFCDSNIAFELHSEKNSKKL